VHRPEPHILLFRRRLGTDPTTGEVNPELERQQYEQFKKEYEL
jgi:cyclin-dependent kinase regulatory subunit CKS1